MTIEGTTSSCPPSPVSHKGVPWTHFRPKTIKGLPYDNTGLTPRHTPNISTGNRVKPLDPGTVKHFYFINSFIGGGEELSALTIVYSLNLCTELFTMPPRRRRQPPAPASAPAPAAAQVGDTDPMTDSPSREPAPPPKRRTIADNTKDINAMKDQLVSMSTILNSISERLPGAPTAVQPQAVSPTQPLSRPTQDGATNHVDMFSLPTAARHKTRHYSTSQLQQCPARGLREPTTPLDPFSGDRRQHQHHQQLDSVDQYYNLDDSQDLPARMAHLISSALNPLANPQGKKLFAHYYVDDFAGVHSTYMEAVAAFADFESLCSTLGLKIAPEKSTFPATHMEWLGFMFNTVDMTITIPPDKLQDIQELAGLWLRKASATVLGHNPPGHVPPGHLPQGHIPPGHLPPGHLPPGHLPPRTYTP